MKVTYPEGSKCFISVLNTSDNALPAVVLNATATVSNNDDDDDGDGDGDVMMIMMMMMMVMMMLLFSGG